MIGLGGNSTLGIGVLIELKDNFTSTSKRVNAELERMQKTAKDIMRDNLRDVGKVGLGMLAFGAALTLGLNSTVKAASQFQLTMTKVKALGEMDSGQSKFLGNLAKNLSKKYGIMPNEIAGGILELVKRGVSGEDIPKALEAQLMTAIGADERLGGEGGVAARMMDMAMAWGYRAQDMSRIGDIMAKGTQLTSMGFLDLAESMKYSQDVMKSLHLTFEEGVAMIGLLSNAGIRGSMAGTALGNFYTQFTIALTGASKKKNSALKALGLSPEDFITANGDMLGLIPTLRKLETALRPFGGISRQGLLNDIFGIRGKRAANPLMDALYPDGKLGMGIEQLLKAVQNSEGSNARIFNQISETFAQRKKRFAATWETFKINVGSALLPALTGILKALTPVLSLVASFAESKVGKVLIAAIASGGLMSLLFGGFLWMVSKIGLGFLNWKSTLDQIRMTMAWVLGGMKGRMVATMPGQNVNSTGSVYDKNGILINAASMASMSANMSQAAMMYRMGRGGVLTRIGRGRASVAGLSRTIGMRGGMLSRFGASLVRWMGPVINLFAGLARVLGPVLSILGRFIPILGWIWTAYSIISALWGGEGDSDPQSQYYNAPPNKYDYQTAYAHKYGDPYVPSVLPPSRYNQKPANINITPSKVDVYVDGEKSHSEKLYWQAQQAAADEGFNQ